VARGARPSARRVIVDEVVPSPTASVPR